MKSKSYTLRRLFNDIHLWLGVGSGLILFVVCFTGTVLTYEEEIKNLFEVEIAVVPLSKKHSIEELSQRLSSEGEVLRVSVSPHVEQPYQFSVKTSPEDRRGTKFIVNQYTGDYLQSQPNVLDGFFMSMFRLHRWLLLDTSVGRPIVGVATLIFVLLSLTGIVLWFPKKKLQKLKWKHLKSGFKIAWRAKWKRFNHDLHVTLGFYTALFLLIMSLTGLFWSFDWYKKAGSAILGTEVFGGRGGGSTIESKADNQGKSINFAEALHLTQLELPFEGTTVLQISTGRNEVYQIRKYHDQDFFKTAVDQLAIDRDGRILNKVIFSDQPFNVQIAQSIKALHIGTVFGGFSKFLYFISCLIATSLPITGVIIWLNKMKKKPKGKR